MFVLCWIHFTLWLLMGSSRNSWPPVSFLPWLPAQLQMAVERHASWRRWPMVWGATNERCEATHLSPTGAIYTWFDQKKGRKGAGFAAVHNRVACRGRPLLLWWLRAGSNAYRSRPWQLGDVQCGHREDSHGSVHRGVPWSLLEDHLVPNFNALGHFVLFSIYMRTIVYDDCSGFPLILSIVYD